MDNSLIIWCHKAKSSITVYEHLWFPHNNSEPYPAIIYSNYLSNLSSTSCALMGFMANLGMNLS